MKRKSVIVIALLALLLLLPLLAQAAPVGKFTSIEGAVDVTSPGKEAIKANLGDSLNVGDIIRTKSKSKSEVTFLDGTVLRIAESSRLRVSEFAQQQEQRTAILNLFRGKIQNIVKTLAGASAEKSKYEIHTPTAVCGVRGTQFFAYHQAGVSGAVVTEGTIYAFSANKPGEVRNIGAGQAMVVINANTPPAVRTATTTETEQHQKDTKPADKPKSEGKGEEKKSETAGGSTDGAQAGSGQKSEARSDDKSSADTASAVTTTLATATGEAALSLLPVIEAGPAILQAPTMPPTTTVPIVPPTLEETTAVMRTLTAPTAVTNATTADFSFETNVPASYRYSLDGAAYVPVAGSTISLSALPEGAHTIDVQAINSSGQILTTTNYAWTVDTTPPATPTVALTNDTGISATDLLTNNGSLSVGAIAAGVTRTYSVDGGTASSTYTAPTTDGSHTVVVNNTDTAGNSVSTSITFTLDFTAPVITLAGTPAAVTNSNSATGITVAATDTNSTTTTYNLDGTAVASPAALTGLSEGLHTLNVTVTDAAGNSSSKPPYTWFIGNRQYWLSSGNVTGDFNGTVSASLSDGIFVISNGTQGGWLINMDVSGAGTLPITLPLAPNLVASGQSSGPNPNTSTVEIGYWLSKMTAYNTGTALSGTSLLAHLSPSRLGYGSGNVTGTISVGAWQAQDLGLGTYTETPLAYVNDIQVVGAASLSALMGGTTSLWAGLNTTATTMGTWSGGDGLWAASVYSKNYTTLNNTTYEASPGAYRGFNSIIMDTGNSVTADMIALYVDPSGNTGYLKGASTGTAYPSASSMFSADGSIARWDMGAAPTGVTAANFYASTTVPAPVSLTWTDLSPSIASLTSTTYVAIFNTDTTWGIGQSVYSGTWAGTGPWTPPATWTATADESTNATNWVSVAWAPIGASKLAGNFTSAKADWTAGSTSVTGGEIKGIFDPAVATWKAISQGAWMETSKFLTMQGGATTDAAANATLAALNIPAVQVGKVDLASGNISLGGSSMSVNMPNTTFFAYSTAAAPRIWATGNVTGTYTGTPVPTTWTFPLTGSNYQNTSAMNATFTVNNWGGVGNKWGATVTNGSGNVGANAIAFTGGVAGSFTGTVSGNFTGTAAGIVK